MRHLFIIAILFCCIVACETKNETGQITSDMLSPDNPPKITFQQNPIDMGELAIGEVKKDTIHFKNEGKSVLILYDVETSCGCTVLDNWTKHPVKPGQSGIIPIQFTPKMTGNVRKSFTVVANTIPSISKLYIKASVKGQTF